VQPGVAPQYDIPREWGGNPGLPPPLAWKCDVLPWATPLNRPVRFHAGVVVDYPFARGARSVIGMTAPLPSCPPTRVEV
jgi:hypothetical protein